MVILFLTEEFRIDVTLAKLMKVKYHINRWEEKNSHNYLHCYVGFSLVAVSGTYSLDVVRGLLTEMASLVVEHRF